MATKCNRKHFAKKLAEAHRMRTRLPADLRPLFNHILALARSSMKSGSPRGCLIAGREIRMATNLVRRHGAK